MWFDEDGQLLDEEEARIAREVSERHAEEDRLERERCEQDEAYASERLLREMGG